MGSRRHVDAVKLSHERAGKQFSTPTRQPFRPSSRQSTFNEELSTFTSRVVRAENASAKHLTRICGGTHVKNRGESVARKPSSALSSQVCHGEDPAQQPTRALSDSGVEHIVLHRIYYAIRNDSDKGDVSLNPEESCSLGGNGGYHEYVELGREDDHSDDNNSNDSKEVGQEVQEGNKLGMTRSDTRESSHVPTTTHSSLRPSQKGHNCRTTLHESLHHRSVSCTGSQVQDSPWSDSLSRATIGADYPSTHRNTNGLYPEISLSTERFQAQVQQDATNFPRSGPYSNSNSADHISAVGQQTPGLACPSGNHRVSVHCTANDAGGSYEISSSSSMSREGLTVRRDVDFVKLRSTVDQVVLDEIRRPKETQMPPVHVAQAVLSKNARNRQVAQIDESNNDSGDIVSTVVEEQSLGVQTRQDHTMAVPSSTSPVATTPSTTMNGYLHGAVIKHCSSLGLSRKASKRTRQILGEDCYKDNVRPKYVKQENISELTANGTTDKASTDWRTDLRHSQEAMDSVQSGWIQREIVVGANSSLWRHESEKHLDGGSSDTSSQRRTEEEAVGDVTYGIAEQVLTTPDAALRHRHSAGEFGENSPRRSPQSDGCVGRGNIHRSSQPQISRQRTHDPLHSEYRSSQPSDSLSAHSFSSLGVTSGSDHQVVCKVPASTFKRVCIMRQDRDATLRVFSAFFQPFSCSQSYVTTSHQNIANACQDLTQDSQKSISMEGRCSQDSEEEQMECSPTLADTGDPHGIQIHSVRSLQNPNIQANVEKARSELPAESTNEISTIEETIGNMTLVLAKDVPSCSKNSNDNFQERSSDRCQSYSKRSLPSCLGLKEPYPIGNMPLGVAKDVPSCSKNSSDNFQESCSDSGQSYSKRALPSYPKNCSPNGTYLRHNEPYQLIPKEVLNSSRWSDVKLFVCPWLHCNMRFKRKDELTRHWRKHSGEKPYECPICGKSFGRRDHQRCHARTVHNVAHLDLVPMAFTRPESVKLR